MISRLLIINRNQAESEQIKQKIENSDINVRKFIIVNSLSKASETIAEEDVDVILVDLDVDLDVIGYLKKITKSIIITLADDENELKGLSTIRRGADECVVKSDNRLIQSIKHCRNKYKMSCGIKKSLDKISQLVGC